MNRPKLAGAIRYKCERPGCHRRPTTPGLCGSCARLANAASSEPTSASVGGEETPGSRKAMNRSFPSKGGLGPRKDGLPTCPHGFLATGKKHCPSCNPSKRDPPGYPPDMEVPREWKEALSGPKEVHE